MKIFFLILYLISAQLLFGQTEVNYDWMNYGFFMGRGDNLENVVLDIDSEGNLINAGSYAAITDYLYIHKISSSGDLIWKLDNFTRDRHEGKILDLMVDETDNIYVTGYYSTVFPSTDIDTLFVKKIISIDKTPKIDWEYRHLIGDDYLNIRNREFKLAKPDSNIVVTGITLNRQPLADIVTIKLDTSGTELWKRYFTNGENYDLSPKDLEFDEIGNIFVYGTAEKDDSSSAQLIKYSPTGDLLWNKTIINTKNAKTYAVDIEVDNESPWVSANSEGVTLLNKYDHSGNLIKEKIRETTGVNLGLSIDASENIYQINNDSIFKYNSLGSFISSTGLPSLANVSFSHFDVDENQKIYVLGQRKRSHFYTAKINQSLEIESAFETIWNDPPGRHHDSSTPYEIAAFAPFGVYITGRISTWDSSDFNFDYSLVTVKYSQLPTEVEEYVIKLNSFRLSQNYPNPFNPSTTINYSIPERSFINISIYNSLGQKVAELVREEKEAGNYSVGFNATELSSGIYFYQINTSSFVETKKMLLLR